MLLSENGPSVHAFVMCWPGWEEGARRIAAGLDGRVDRLTVFFMNDTGLDESGPGEWRRVPSDRFYGGRFRESLDLNRGDAMLHVHADAGFGDWPALAARCREAFRAHPDLGVWSPDVFDSWYTPPPIKVGAPREDGTLAVTVTDRVVWALSSAVVEALKSLDYSANNLGWGVTEAAAAVAVTTNRTIAMDLTLKVQHPQGSGYDRDKALRESLAFRRGLSPAQQAYFEVLTSLAQVRQALDAPRSRWPSRLKAALRARLRPGPVASDP